MSILFYKRPAHVPPQRGPLGTSDVSSTEACANAAIPAELSFENVVCNKCAPPCSLQDFLNYLIYIEHDAENLQFYLWMVDYYQRFRKAPESEKELSPSWKGMMYTKEGQENHPAYPDPPELDITDVSCVTSEWDGEFSDNFSTTTNDLKFSVSRIKELPPPPLPALPNQKDANLVSQTTTPTQRQPFRTEINRIIDHYVAEGAPRQLNLADHDRATVLQALKHTTHPSAFNPVKRMLDTTLRQISHPNFIRWSICNGNKSWTLGLRLFALTNITLGFLIATLLTLSHASRYYRIFAALEWWFGITNLIAASRGLCVLLHRLHTRQHHAWETTTDPHNNNNNRPLDRDDERMLKGHLDIDYISYESTKPTWPVKMEVFGPANGYAGEEWVRTYPRRAWWRKLFEGRVEVRDPGLKSIQDRMIRQAEAWALLITVVLTIVFCAIPPANLF